jgi:uncharacterized protein (TIGR02099 family)
MVRWIFVLLLLCTLLLVSGWGLLNGWIVPRIDEFRPWLEKQASQAVGAVVQIGSIAATSQGLLPVLELHDVAVLDAQGQDAVRLPRIVATPSLRSLLRGGLEQLYIDAPALDMRRSADGRIFVAGLELAGHAAGDPNVADWLLAQREIVVRHGALRWTDALRDAPLLALQEVDIVLRHSGRRHAMRLDATPPPAWGSRFSLRGDFRQPQLWTRSGEWQSWGGQVYAEFPWVDLAQLRRYTRPGDLGVVVEQGVGALRVWGDVAAGAVQGGVADVALAGVNATTGPGLEPLVLHAVQGRVAAHRLAKGFTFSTKGLQFQTDDGLVWPGGNMALTYTDKEGAIPAYGELHADKLDLSVLRRVANRLPLGDAAHAALQSYAPAGLVETLNLSWQGAASAPSQYRGRGRVTGLELAAQKAVGQRAATPGVRGADIEFDVNQSGGRAVVAMQHGAFDLPGIFDEPVIPLDAFGADARWQVDGDQIAVQMDNLRFANADAQGRARLSWRTSDPDTSGSGSRFPGVLDLTGNLSRAQAQRVHRYLPSVLDAQARDYVRDAVQSGAVTGAQFRIKGDLHDLPFRDPRQGEFRIAAQLRNVVYDYAPARLLPAGSKPWPALTQLGGELVFERAGMRVNQATGRLAGMPQSRVVRTDASIPDLEHSVVNVTADVQGPLAEMLGMVRGSPAAGMTSHALDAAMATGTADLKLKLGLPIADIEKSTVRGSVALAGNDVRITPDIPLLGRARGVVDFSEKGFSLNAVQARMLGGDVRLEGGMPPTGAAVSAAAAGAATAPDAQQMSIRAQGTLSAEGLRQARELGLVARLAERMAGATAYTATLGMRRGVPELQVTSSLEGMAVDLPAPLRKTAAAALPLHFENSLLPSSPTAAGAGLRDRLQLRLGALVAQVYERDLSGAQPRVLRGAIGVNSGGGGVVLDGMVLPDAGVVAQAQVAALDIDAWRSLLAGGAGAGADTDAATGYLPTALALRAQELTLFGRTLHDVVVGGSRVGSGLRANVDAREMNGYVEYRPAAQGGAGSPGGVFARLARLNIPRSATTGVENLLDTQPATMPALDIVVEDLELSGRKLGRVVVDAVNRTSPGGAGGAGGRRDWLLNKLQIRVPEAEMSATGSWSPRVGKGGAVDGAGRTTLDFHLDIKDSGELLARFGMPDVVRRGKGRMEGQVAWDGSPLGLDYPSMSGKLNVNVESGQFLKADPGLAKLLGVLSLQNLSRRLSLDFRDVFSQGFAFDSVRGDVQLARGVASTDNMQMRGANAVVLMDGTADLARETQGLRVVVVPEIHAGTAALVAAMVNPAIGLGTFLAQIALKGPLTEAATREFRIDGGWAEPRITRVAARPKEPALKVGGNP